MLQDEPLLIGRLVGIDRHERDACRPGGKVQHDGDVMVEEDRRQPVPAPKPDPVVDDDDSGAVEDNRWTWVEAAAEAWLANRPEKASGTSDPSKDTPS